MVKISALVFAFALLAPVSMLAQKEEKEKDKDEREKRCATDHHYH